MEPNDFRQNGEETAVDQKALELQENFTYDGYQVVRRELFAHLREPSVVIRRIALHSIRLVLQGWRMPYISKYL